MRPLAPLACCLALAGCFSSSAIDPASPEAAVLLPVQHARDGDVAALLERSIPAEVLDEARRSWEETRSAPLDPEQRMQIDGTLGMLTAPSAVDNLMLMIEPQLAQVQPQQLAAMIRSFGGMAVAQAGQQGVDQRSAAELVEAIAAWVESSRLDDPALAREAVTAFCDGVRALGIDSVEQVRQLDFDQLLDKAGVLLATVKQVLAVYGVSVDEMLDSYRVEVRERSADRAVLAVQATLFDTAWSDEIEVRRVGDRWFAASALEMDPADLRGTAPAPEAAPAPVLEAAPAPAP